MLVLFETPAGYSLFKVSNEKKLLKTEATDIYETFFQDSAAAHKALEMVGFQAFQDTADAVAAATAAMEGSVTAGLKSFLKKKLKKAATPEILAVAEPTLGASLKDTGLPNLAKIAHDDRVKELFRGIRCHMDELLGDEDAPQHISPEDIRAMQLGLSHSLGRYKLKFSADKVDTMVIQAVGLLDELDKEINTYAMRVKEWYGWHFPELQALVGDNVKYSKLVLHCGLREKFKDSDLSSILEDEAQEAAIKDAAEISMGTEIAALDQINIQALAEQVLSMTEYRAQLYEYLRNRMNAIAPNLTILVGELVGARLIAHAGSLMNLAKQPASTVQILGAEKALFRALKTKHDTPKYGLIYHASLIGQAAPKHKGKISRVLAAKASLAIRVDALSDETQDALDTTVGFEGRAKVEARLRQLETGTAGGGTGLPAQKTARYDPVAAKQAAAAPAYNAASDMVLDNGNGRRDSDSDAEKKKKKKDKKKNRESTGTTDSGKSKKDKKRKSADSDDDDDEDGDAEERKKAKKAKKEKKKSKN